MNRKDFMRQGMQAAVDLRDRLDLDPFLPTDPFLAAASLGVKVVFLDTSMEGFYFKQGSGRILLSSKRPVPRRAFTCAHELGHHWFGHGSTIDELQEDERPDATKPEEILANAFAAFLLMPSVGLRGAFAKRGWTPSTASPMEVFTIACQFGVGYGTLINHLSYTLREITPARRDDLERCTPLRIRRLLAVDEYDAALVVDAHNEALSFEMEKGGVALVPSGADVKGKALEHVKSFQAYELYKASRRGIATVSSDDQSFEVRVMPKEYVGSAANRFLEDPDEQD